MWDMNHSYVGHDSFMRGIWIMHMWDMTHLYVGHESFLSGKRLAHLIYSRPNSAYSKSERGMSRLFLAIVLYTDSKMGLLCMCVYVCSYACVCVCICVYVCECV